MSKIMTRSPIFVTSDSLAIEALQKMVQGKYLNMHVCLCCCSFSLLPCSLQVCRVRLYCM